MSKRPNPFSFVRYLPASLVALILASLVCLVLILVRANRDRSGLVYWSFSKQHLAAYQPMADKWNAAHKKPKVHLTYISERALTSRMMGAFFANTPTADLVEMNQGVNVNAWRGPAEAVGFRDLKPLLERDGLLDSINPPSITPWERHGHIYGLPHDVHPVLLCYRADIIEAAGIDVSKIETWDDFFETMAPLCGDFDGDGYTDRYALELPEFHQLILVMLVDQAGVVLVDSDDNVKMASPEAAHVLAKLAAWASRPNKMTADLAILSAAAAKPLIDGVALAWLTPDWRVSNMKETMMALEGKIKLMPVPAWEPGGRRTSVLGGTMLGLPKVTRHDDPEDAWKFAKHLYFSRETAEALYNNVGIISPFKQFWDDPVYDRPEPFFMGQPVGRMYIEQAPNVPVRSSSPYRTAAEEELLVAFNRLISYAEQNNTKDIPTLEKEAMRLLKISAKNVRLQIERSAFPTDED